VRAQIGRDVVARLEANPAVKRAKVETAQMYTYPDFLSDAECDTLIALIDSIRALDSARAPARIRNTAPATARTSIAGPRRCSPIDERIAHLLGIPPENAETLQGQRYAVNQQFRAHCDYFHEIERLLAQRMKETGGQRTWTAMAYLNDVEEGGATWFPRAGVRFKPKRGLLRDLEQHDA
jgi:prolyl 4-hydroxylase